MLMAFGEGRITKDAEVFTYGQNKTGVSFTLACNRGFGGEDDTTSFLRCTMYGRDENFAQYLKTGNQVIVQGDLTIKPYEKDDPYSGQPTLVVNSLTFGAKKQ